MCKSFDIKKEKKKDIKERMLLRMLCNIRKIETQLTLTCLKSTNEALEKMCKICSKSTIATRERRH